MTIAISWPPIGGVPYLIPQTGETNWGALTNFLVALASAQSTTAQKIAARVATASPVTVTSATDCAILVNLTVPGPTIVNLPPGVQGQYFNISDAKGDAGTNNITIVPNGAQTINGDPSFIINANDDAVTVLFDVSTQNWKVTTQILSFSPGSVARAAIQAGAPGYVVINNPVGGLLSEEQFLDPLRGGLGVDASLFTGVVKALGGVFSASTLVNADVDAAAGIDATKLSTGIVNNTEFDRLNELGILYSTTKVTGGVGSVNGGNPALFDLTAGTGKIPDYSGTPATPTITALSWSAFTAQTLTNLATADITYVSISPLGALVQSTTFPTPAEQRTNIFLARINHSNRVSISFIDNIGNNSQSLGNQWCDLVDALGAFNVSGNTIASNGANLTFQKSAGMLFSRYYQQVSTPTNPHVVSIASAAPVTFAYRTQLGGTTGNVTDVDPTNYDVGGVVTLVPGGGATSTIQRVFLFPSGNVRIQYGQNIYANLADAIAAISTDTFVIASSISGFAVLIGYIVVQKNCVSLAAATARLIPAARFDAGGGGGSIATTTLQAAYINSVQPQITLNATQGALQIRDASAPLGTELFQVQSNTGATTFFSVSVAGISGSNFPTANRVMVTDASSKIGQSSITTTEVGFLSGTTGVTGTGSLVRSSGAAVTLFDFDGSTASNTSRLTVPKNTYANLLALTRKEGTILYATDLDVLLADDGITLTPIGSSSSTGVLNIIDNPSAASATTGWTAAANYTNTRDTSNSPLAGVIDTCFAMSTTTASAESSTSGVYAATQLNPAALRNTKLQVSVFANIPATSLGVWRLSVYNASGTRMSLSSDSSSVTTLPGGFNGQFVCTFDADSSASYTASLTQTTRSSANTLYITNITIGPGITAQGAAVSDWVSYTPTGSWSSNTTYTGFYKRDGSDLLLNVQVATSGAPTAASLTVNLPSGLTINTSALVNSTAGNRPNLGMGNVFDGTTEGYTVQVTYNSTTSVAIFALGSGGTYSDTDAVSQTVPITFGASDGVTFNARVPIAEWTGNGTVNLGQGAQVQIFSSTTGTWDAAAAAGNTVAGLSPITGALGANRNKVVRLPYAPQSINDIKIIFLPTGYSVPIPIELYGGYVGLSATDFGARVTAISGTDVTVTFYRYHFQGATYNTLPGVDWVAGDGAWGLMVANPSAPVGFGLAGTDGSSGLVAPYSAAGVIASGTYTPTITNGTNVSSTTTQICNYTRVGAIVTVYFNVSVTTTAAANTASDFDISLPIASNLSLGTDLSGSGARNAASGTATGAALVSANTVNDRATVIFNSTVTTSNSLLGSFGYIIK